MKPVIANGAWLAPTRSQDVIEMWKRDCPELISLTARLDALFEAWLKLVAPCIEWDGRAQSLRAETDYDGYIPGEREVSTFRKELLQSLDRFKGDWRSATLADLVNPGLERQVASYVHAERPTRAGGVPDFAKRKSQ